ncbi:hypothetical protein BDW71DRAFT_196262 [Aspergillus fruticulosus]
MPPRTRDEQRKDGPGTQKRKPVRRDPEKRRQQNIQAQKKYRMLTIGPGEKLRQRLERLEALAATAAQNTPVSQVPDAGQGLAETEPTLFTTQSNSTATAIPDSASHVPASSLSIATTGYSQPAPQLGDFSLDLNLQNPNPYPPIPNNPSLSSIWDPTTLPLLNETVWYPPPVEQLTEPSTPEVTLYYPTDHAPQPAVSSFPISTSSNNPITIRGDHTNRPSLAWTVTIDCGCSNQHFTLQSGGPFSANPRQVKILATMPIADPYHVGIAMDAICAEESPSPFFRADASSADPLTKANVVAAVQKAFKPKLKHDLRPTKEQITINHHPIIDVYPFPTLRNNLVSRQGEYDEDEFFHDSLAGLICWGSAGVGLRDRNVSAGKASTGTPWDLRSWEAQEWFLKKYWNLMGGEDGELVRQTEWWRSIRGEDALDVVEL